MPSSVHNSQTSLTPARAERSLLRELGLPVSISATDASEHWANDGCAALFLRGLERRGLTFVHRREVARVKTRIKALPALGRPSGGRGCWPISSAASRAPTAGCRSASGPARAAVPTSAGG
jgi:hypothetical protein